MRCWASIGFSHTLIAKAYQVHLRRPTFPRRSLSCCASACRVENSSSTWVCNRRTSARPSFSCPALRSSSSISLHKGRGWREGRGGHH